MTVNVALKYGGAIGVVVGVSLVKLFVPGIGDEAPALLYLLGIFLVAHFGSFPAALLATVLSAIAMNLLFAAPRFGVSSDVLAVVKSVILLIEGVFVSWLAHRARVAHQQLTVVQERLEEQNRRLTNLMQEVLDRENGTYTRSARRSKKNDLDKNFPRVKPEVAASAQMVAGATADVVPPTPSAASVRDILGAYDEVKAGKEYKRK